MDRRLCHNCDTKPVLAAHIDFFDELRLLILRNLLKTRLCPKIPAYRLARRRKIGPPFALIGKIAEYRRAPEIVADNQKLIRIV